MCQDEEKKENEIIPRLTLLREEETINARGDFLSRTQTHALKVPIEGGYVSDRDNPTALAVEEFLNSIGLRMPSRRAVGTLGAELKQLKRNHVDNETLLRETSKRFQAWRDYAIALDEERAGRGAPVSRKTRALDPRRED